MATCFEQRLCAEVRRHPHLYDASLSDYHVGQVLSDTWGEIARALGEDESTCRQKWRYLRDKYVRAKRKQREGRGACRDLPSSVSRLEWLSDFTGRRPRDSQRKFSFSVDETACLSARPVQVSCLGPQLPLSSLQLLVPPLRLMSACMWQVAQERNVDQYDKLVEFIMLVTEMVPELLNYKQKTQLILGLRARVILESLKRMDEVDCEAIQDHLNSFKQMTTNHTHEEDPDGEVETSKSAFMAQVQTLLTDQTEKEKFFKEVFPVQYGARFDTALQILVWEFFYRLEEFLPVPSFSQVFSMFDVSSLDYTFEQFVSDPEDLRTVLQQQQERKRLTKSEFAFMSDTILCTLASKQTSVASKHHVDQAGKQDSGKSPAIKQEKSENAEDICEDDEETDDSSDDDNPNSPLQEYGLSPLTSSPCSEAGGDEPAGEASFLPPLCSVEGVKEHLDLGRNKESSEESTIQSFNEDSKSSSKNICQKRYTTSASCYTLRNHESVHTSARPFKCTQCDKAYKNRKDLRHHLRIHSNPEGASYACSLCKKEFSSRSSARPFRALGPGWCIHANTQGSGAINVTSVENGETAGEEESTIQSFREVSKSSNKHICHKCGKTLSSRNSLRNHQSVHSSARPFKCTKCNKAFKTRKELRRHFLYSAGHLNPETQFFPCSLCDKTYSSPTTLRIHLRQHSGEKPYVCSYCGRRFMSKTTLQSHVRIHTGERPYACTFCNKRFTQPYVLTVHIRKHTKENPYLCSTCGKSFPSSGALRVHSRNHTGERPYQCDICGKRYATLAKMKVHRRFHTGEKPYSCSKCDKSFRCATGLGRHMKTHTGEKPYQCVTCHKSFSLRSNLRVHHKVHNNI